MVVLVLEKCPMSLRGDVTRWLMEISTGVYVGNIHARVRDRLWDRVRDSIHDGSGRAIMVYTTNTEQGYAFRTYNSTWIPCDFEGLTLILRRHQEDKEAPKVVSHSFAYGRKTQHKVTGSGTSYVAVDIETTGLDSEKDKIIEIGAIKVIDGVSTPWQTVVRQDTHVPPSITSLTGITDDDVAGGLPQAEALRQLVAFCGNLPIISHNATFDHDFIDEALLDSGYDELPNQWIDTLQLSRQRFPKVRSYRLHDLLAMIGENQDNNLQAHRALDDATATKILFESLRSSV